MKIGQVLSLLVVGATLVHAGNIKIGGDSFFHYTYRDDGKNDFDFKRVYLTIEQTVSDAISYKFQADIGSGGPTDYSLYLKNAKLDWNTDFGKFTLGMQGMNMFKIQENNWGHRFIEKMGMDLHEIASSADLGIAWDKKIGAVVLNLMVTNGTGYKKTEDDKFKKVSARLMTGQSNLKDGFNVGLVTSYEGFNYNKVDGSPAQGVRSVVGGFGGAALGALRLAGEYTRETQVDENTLSRSLLSVYGNYTLTQKLAVFGRHDLFASGSSHDHYSIMGMNYLPEKQLSIAPNILVRLPDAGSIQTVYRLSFRFKI